MKISRGSRMLSVLLIVVMLFTMTGVSSFAEGSEEAPEETKNVLVFGASTSSGYGLSNFLNQNRGFAVDNNDLEQWTYDKAAANYAEYEKDKDHGREKGYYPKGRASEDAYPWKLKKYIADTEFDGDLSKVNLSPLMLNGMRTNELRGFLDPEYAVDAFNLENEFVPTGKGFYVEHIQSILDCIGDGGAMVDMEDGKGPVHVWSPGEDRKPGSTAYMRAHKYVEDEVKKADVIVVDVCMNNFGTYLANRVAAIYGIPGFEGKEGFGDQTPESIIGASPSLIKTANKLKETMMQMVPVLKSNKNVEVLIDAFIYCYVDCITNLNADINMIKELKKDDAKIIVVGVYNTLDGITTEINGEKYEFGEIASYGFKMLNTHIRALSENSNEYYYADVQDNIETFMNQVVQSESYNEFVKKDENDSVLNQMYHGNDSFYDLFLKSQDKDVADPENDENSFLNQYREPAKVLLYRAAKHVDLHMDELLANLSNLYNIGDEIGLFFTAVGGHRGIPPTYPGAYDSLTEAQEATITSYFIDQKLRGEEKNDIAMGTAINGFVMESYGVPYVFGTDEDGNSFEQTAKACTYWALTADGMDEDDAAAGIGAEDKSKIPSFPQDSTMELLQILDRFIVYQGIGQHPSKDGCEAMYQDVKAAYDKAANGGDTAYAEVRNQILADMADLVEMLRQTGAKDDIDAIIEKIEKIQEALDMIDEAQASMDELKEFLEIKKQFEEYVGETLDLLGITMDDLKAQGEFIADHVDPVWVAEQIKALNEIIMNWPELQEEYKAKIEEYAEQFTELIDKTVDELIKQKDAFENSEAVKKIIEAIEVMRDAVKNMPSKDEIVEKVKKALEDLEAQIEEAAASISQELADQIKDLREAIEKAVKEQDFQDIIDQLMPIGEKLIAIGEAVAGLPEYEEAMNAYLEASNEAMAGLKDRVVNLEKQMGELTAKSIKVDLAAKPTFGAKTSKVDLSWEVDEDAAGYILKVDGAEVEAKETETGLAYEQAGIKVGTKYTYEVTPYIMYQIDGETETIYGQTFKKEYTPKVTLKKVTLKKVKAAKKSFKATWKKLSGIDGYQVNYKTGKKAKNKLVKGAKKASVKIKKLKKGKKYTVKVRAYKTVNGKKYYGKWSKAKKVKVK